MYVTSKWFKISYQSIQNIDTYLMSNRLSVFQDVSSHEVELVEGFDDLLDHAWDRSSLPLLFRYSSGLVYLTGLTLKGERQGERE